MDILWRNISFAGRMMRRQPGYAITVVLVMALGVGANTLIFSLLNSVEFRPLPYKTPERLVAVWRMLPKEFCDALKLKENRATVSYSVFKDWSQKNQVFESMAGLWISEFNCHWGNQAERLTTAGVTESFFSTLGVQPFLGRAFLSEDFVAGGRKSVVISHAMWKERMGERADIVGQTLQVEDHACIILGVMPHGFNLPFRNPSAPNLRDPLLWTPLSPGIFDARFLNSRGWNAVGVIARMKSGIDLRQAQANMDLVVSQLRKENPDDPASVKIQGLRESLFGNQRRWILTLLAPSGIILLIICANLANLQLARSQFRLKEMAVREALGASRLRLAGLILTENCLHSLMGGIVGATLSSMMNPLVNYLLSLSISAMPEIVIDFRVGLFSLILAFFAGVAYGMIPVLRSTRSATAARLKNEGWIENAHQYFGKSLIAGEIALALVLLASAGLLVRSFLKLTQVDVGIQAANTLTMKIPLSQTRLMDPLQQKAFYQQALERVARLPGVQTAAISSSLPVRGAMLNSVEIEGQAKTRRDESRSGNLIVVSPEYFKSLGIPLKHGRLFEGQDSQDSPPVAIISEGMARRYFPGRNSLGAHICESWWGKPWRTIVGVVGDVRQDGIAEEAWPAIYYCYTQAPQLDNMKMIVHTSLPSLSLADPVRRCLQAIDPAQPVSEMKTMEYILRDSLLDRRLLLSLTVIFAGVALLLGCLGVYGVLSYATSRRTRELGIRMALGARAGELVRMIVRQGMLPVLIGVVVGLTVALATARIISSWLYGISPNDPATYAGIICLLCAVASLACYMPARRAAKVDPIIALRIE